MAVNSRAKGKRFELELASRFRDYGYDARRGQQYSGVSGDADVIGLPGIHVEAKRRERMELYDWMAQAKADAKSGELPAVFHRKSNCEVLVTMELGDWMRMYREWELRLAEEERDKERNEKKKPMHSYACKTEHPSCLCNTCRHDRFNCCLGRADACVIDKCEKYEKET